VAREELGAGELIDRAVAEGLHEAQALGEAARRHLVLRAKVVG
jgi:hypothetical protein